MSGAGTPPAPSPSRTLYIDGRARPPAPLAWPNMTPGSTLDFAVDYTAWLADALGGQAGSINQASIGVAISGDGQLVTVSRSFVGNALIFVFTGGTAGAQYGFSIIVSTTAAPNLTLALQITLTINQA
jgi:hypothetical protein